MMRKNKLRAAGTFHPTSLFGASDDGGFWDTADIETLWQNTAGTTAVEATGQAVRRIDDQSGNGNHMQGGGLHGTHSSVTVKYQTDGAGSSGANVNQGSSGTSSIGRYCLSTPSLGQLGNWLDTTVYLGWATQSTPLASGQKIGGLTRYFSTSDTSFSTITVLGMNHDTGGNVDGFASWTAVGINTGLTSEEIIGKDVPTFARMVFDDSAADGDWYFEGSGTSRNLTLGPVTDTTTYDVSMKMSPVITHFQTMFAFIIDRHLTAAEISQMDGWCSRRQNL